MNNKTPTNTYIDKELGRYELNSGTHKNFCEVLYYGGKDSFVLRWGRVDAKKIQTSHVKGFHKVLKKVNTLTRNKYQHLENSLKTYPEIMKKELSNHLSVSKDSAHNKNYKRKKM